MQRGYHRCAPMRSAVAESTLLGNGDTQVAQPPVSRYGSGRSIKRVEDEALLRGQGRFADNVKVEGEVFACFVRSPHPHANIVAVDTRAADAMPGVIAVLTGQELVAAGVSPIPNS